MTGSPSAGARTCTPIGRPASPRPNGTLIARMAGEVRRDRTDVREVHRQRVGGLLPDRERLRRGARREEDVEPLVRGGEVADDERAHLLRLPVVGVVVPGGQRVGPEHDPALHLGTESRVPGARVHVRDVLAVDAQAVADAVVAGQVRRRLGRRDEVVGGQAVGAARHGDAVHRGTRGRQGRSGTLDRLPHAPVDAVDVGQLAHHADPQTRDVGTTGERIGRGGDGGRVHRVVTPDRLEQERRVVDRRRERSDLVEARREGDSP